MTEQRVRFQVIIKFEYRSCKITDSSQRIHETNKKKEERDEHLCYTYVVLLVNLSVLAFISIGSKIRIKKTVFCFEKHKAYLIINNNNSLSYHRDYISQL